MSLTNYQNFMRQIENIVTDMLFRLVLFNLCHHIEIRVLVDSQTYLMYYIIFLISCFDFDIWIWYASMA